VTLPFPETDPRYALFMFMGAWRRGDYDEMLRWTQQTWKQSVPSPRIVLRSMFVYKPTMIELAGTKLLSEVAFEASLNITYEIARGVDKVMPVKATVVKETSEMVPSPDGTWGVNPTSVHVL
jgi:hypothetical protein